MKTLKPLELTFAEAYASGGYTPDECVAIAYLRQGKKVPKNKSGAAHRLLKKKHVAAHIAYLRKEHERVAMIDAAWVRKELIAIVKNGKDSDKRGALDQLSRMNGYYEKDNEQKKDAVTVQMSF